MKTADASVRCDFGDAAASGVTAMLAQIASHGMSPIPVTAARCVRPTAFIRALVCISTHENLRCEAPIGRPRVAKRGAARAKPLPNLLKEKALPSSGRASNWVQGLDLNQRPSGYEPDELPGCSTLQQREVHKCPLGRPCQRVFIHRRKLRIPTSLRII